jgi:hypothetical protein
MFLKAISGFFISAGIFIAGVFGLHHIQAPVNSEISINIKAPVLAATSTSITATSSPVEKVVESPKPVAPVKATLTTEIKSASSNFDTHAIPLGDGKVSSSPKVGYVYSCQQSFRGGGASHTGDWINGSTWDLSKKLSVEGNVYWNQATFSNVISGMYRVLTGNGLPVSEPTGIFPIRTSDPAYQIDRNPNTISTQNDSFNLPLNPTFASSPLCVPMGIIGVALDGVAIYNALDASGRDAVAHEVQDSCDGHPEMTGEYHYHGPSPCMPHYNESNAVVGYALDGFPITSMYDSNHNYYTDADLDECHGTTTPIVVDGKIITTYHYVLTQEYPYTVGCFRGTPDLRHMRR